LFDSYAYEGELIFNSNGFFVDEYEYVCETYSPVWSNHDILNADGSVYFAASDPIPLDGMNVIEWDGVHEPPYWDGNRDGYGMWDLGDGTFRLAPYAEASNAIAVIGGEVYTYHYIDTDYWEVYESFEAFDEGDYERRGAYADREYGICACERGDDEGNIYRTSLIAYTPVPTTVDYTITYETAQGTAPDSKVITVNEGESYAFTEADLPILSADGYLFGGWSVNGEIISAGYEISADTVLVAVWVEDLPVSKIDPTSMLMGWLVGRRIAGMRGKKG
jgi:hypothetical protein